MGAVSSVARRRLTVRWQALVAAGLLLGLGFGVCLASLAAARSTSSAYERILAAADAPDAAVAHGAAPEESEQSLGTIEGITRQQVYAGFRGVAEGVDPALTGAMLAPVHDDFPLERPVMRDGRLPNPDRVDEVFVNGTAASGAGLEVGQRLTFHLLTPASSATATETVTIVGIGTMPVEAVRDETSVFGLVAFTRAFYETHRELVVYSVSNVELAPGFDARRDLATAVGALGHELQAVRSQEQDAINESLRPLVIVLVALGLLALAATAVAAGQIIPRVLDRGGAEGETLRTLGMVRAQLRLTDLVSAGVVALLAIITAVGAMLAASPVATVGPLHDLDPMQGLTVDATVAVVGAVAIAVLILLLTFGVSSDRRDTARRAPNPAPWLANVPGPTAAAGLTLAMRGDGGGRPWRQLAATTIATALLAMCATFVPSAVALSETPSHYGLGGDLIALNAYGDQSPDDLGRAFGGNDDVVAATGFTLTSLLLDGRGVPALAATAVKGELTPTILDGRPVTAADEIVVGRDTLESLGANVDDVVPVQLATSGSRDAGEALDLRIVGVATFPPVSQVGSDVPRLGTGALVSRDTYQRLGGDDGNQPEFTVVRVGDGTSPATIVTGLPDGFRDILQTPTMWFTDAKPAEITQLDAVMPYVRGAPLVGYAILLAVLAHALWTRARATRRDLAVLQAVGCTGGQLRAITVWQAVPAALAALLIGLPVGIALGRFAFRQFASSLAVVDDVSTNAATVGALVIGLLAAAAVAALLSLLVARRVSAATALRAG